MKIYYETNFRDEAVNRCPWGEDCNVGSIKCKMNCPHCLWYKEWNVVDVSTFYVNGKVSMRQAQYVECCQGENVSLWKRIKGYFYKYIY